MLFVELEPRDQPARDEEREEDDGDQKDTLPVQEPLQLG
jgi:hypothetical protein